MLNITLHNLKNCYRACYAFLQRNFIKNTSNFSTDRGETPPKTLYRHLMRQCEKLPPGPQQHYRFMIKQSFKQHKNETDPERIKQIVSRSYEDADWILRKVTAQEITRLDL